ncbi:MAG TPA: glycosyltransferase [Thermoanaerobaculia bacterium]|nr:glycosyltransferase [Thermoanaerobaculia bacterium]
MTETRTPTPARAGPPDVSVVLVHYHAPAPVASAVAALRRDLEGSRLRAEWLVVDNGSTAEERGELLGLGLPVAGGGVNRGFAAGVNLGIERASADAFLVLNPDVVVLPGCVRALLDELERGAGAAAPRLYWDQDRRFLLPPGEERSRAGEVLALAACRWPWFAARARARWRREARRHWEATGSLVSLRLSGAVLALSRAAWRRVGPLDEGYRLYFEETDWLLRLAAAGLEARQAAGAEALHGFAHSTKDEPMASTWFEESARRFRAAHYGSWFAWLHDRLASVVGRSLDRAPRLPAWREGVLTEAVIGAGKGARPVWLELSPNTHGFPAAGSLIQADELARWVPPFGLMRASGLGGMSLCVACDDGRELGRCWIEAPAADQNRSPSPMVR